jgi:pyruvate kinase
MRRMQLWWGIYPVQYEHEVENVDDLVWEAVRAVYEKGLLNEDKDIVFTSGVRHIPGRTNVIGVFHVKDLIHLPKSRY